MSRLRPTLPILAVVALLALPAIAAASTAVPGKQGPRVDSDGNGIPDEGRVVNGHYTSLYAYDGNGDYYWDLGDGRIQGTVSGPDELDQATLNTCDYVINYRGTFENDPFLDSGVIQNHIRCYGQDGNGHWNYLIVHRTDPRYTGNPAWALWGEWEYHVLTESGAGNLVHARPSGHVGG
ncbi:MAG: hypothetical protein ACRDL6_02540 [Solirubrobacterales bacterium]